MWNSKAIVPIRDSLSPAPNNCPDVPTYKFPNVGPLVYKGGPLLTSVEVYTIFWGLQWSLHHAEIVSAINHFFDEILVSPLMEQLTEYSVPGKTIGYGTRTGSKTFMAQPGGVSGKISDDQIYEALQMWIQNHDIPPSNENSLYFVYLPPNIEVNFEPYAKDISCCNICGYHWGILSETPLYYAVVPYPDCYYCQFDEVLTGRDTYLIDAVAQALMSTSSHELCEAITDPAPPFGWVVDGSHCEIADICTDWKNTNYYGFSVQKEWSNRAGMCLLQHETTGWHRCEKCLMLCYDAGSCPAGGEHKLINICEIALATTPNAPGHDNWHYCGKCGSLWWYGDGIHGVCPKGGGHIAGGGSDPDYNYHMNYDAPTAFEPDTSWRYCLKCHSLWWAGEEHTGVCPAGGGHVQDGSLEYRLKSTLKFPLRGEL